jgi:hypothetical protein
MICRIVLKSMAGWKIVVESSTASAVPANNQGADADGRTQRPKYLLRG